MATQKKYDIDNLTIAQLGQFSKAVEEEITFLQESLDQLKLVKKKFVNSRDTVKSVDPKEANKKYLIPLTETASLYSKNIKFFFRCLLKQKFLILMNI